MRPPAVAGSFYAADPAGLRAQVEACFLPPRGPGALSSGGAGPRRLRALVVPHAGLPYSGPVAAHAYAALAADGWPDAFVIIGPDHRGVAGLAALSPDDWETPLGVARQPAALRKALEGPVTPLDAAAHAEEHSVEVQLPFLQWLADRAGKPLAFVPVLMGMQDETTAQELAAQLVEGIRGSGLHALLVASSDLMHAGPNYSIPPPRGVRVDAFVRAQDEPALRAIAALDGRKLLDEVAAKDISMCGAGPVAAVLMAAKRLGATEARVLAHLTSYDVQPHPSAVGYGAAAVA